MFLEIRKGNRMNWIFIYLSIMMSGLFPSNTLHAQDNADKVEIYQLLMKDLLSSGTIDGSERIGIIDSTCAAVFYGGFPDSINLKYFGYDANNYIDGELFRRNFMTSSAHLEMVPSEIYSDSGFIKISMENFRKYFSNPKQPQEIVLTDKGFEKFAKQYQTDCFCQYSIPYIFNKKTALVYLNYQCGTDNSFPNIYLLEKGSQGWGIITKLRSWGS
jgi:hypothetical protein